MVVRWLLFVMGFGLYTCVRWMYQLSSTEPVVVEQVVRTATGGGRAEEPAGGKRLT